MPFKILTTPPIIHTLNATQKHICRPYTNQITMQYWVGCTSCSHTLYLHSCIIYHIHTYIYSWNLLQWETIYPKKKKCIGFEKPNHFAENQSSLLKREIRVRVSERVKDSVKSQCELISSWVSSSSSPSPSLQTRKSRFRAVLDLYLLSICEQLQTFCSKKIILWKIIKKKMF